MDKPVQEAQGEYERLQNVYQAFLNIACALICLKQAKKRKKRF